MSGPQQIWDAKDFPLVKRPSLYTGDSNTHWRYPEERRPDGNFIFANVDTTYRIVPISEVPEHCLSKKLEIYKKVIKEVPVIDIYGISKGEHSVTTHVWGAEPYFYVSCQLPGDGDEKALSRRVKHRLQLLMMGIDPDNTSSEHRNMLCEYTEKYARLIPGEIDLDQVGKPFKIPPGLFKDTFKLYVLGVDVIDARSIYGAHERDRKFLKVTMVSPRMVSKARSYFQDPKYYRFKQPTYGKATQTFESNVAFVTRQMCDRRIRGAHWLKAKWTYDSRIAIDLKEKCQKPYPYMLHQEMVEDLDLKQFIHDECPKTGKKKTDIYKNLKEEYGLHKSESSSQIEFDVRIEDIEGIPDDPQYENVLPPLRVWSLDIEVANSVRGMFPSATNPGDKFITSCGVAYYLGGASKPFDITAFVLGGVEGDMEVDEKWGVKPENFHVYAYRSEEELFEGLQAYIRDLDPDIVSGYNILGFDLKFLCERAKYLKLKPEQWGYFGRSTDKPVSLKRCTFQSNAYGRKEFDVAMMTGRCQLDVLETIQRDYTCKYRSYKLDACAKEILGESKEDVPFWEITPLYMKNGESRKRMVSYCVTDAYLPPLMEERKGHGILYVEQARLYGVSITELILRGQQHRLLTFLINFCLDLERQGEPKLLIPKNVRISTSSGKRDVQFEGATVVDPDRGYYEEPVATIDFASLYPSIMLAHNLCYSTMIPPYMRKFYSEDQYFVTPSGDAFLYEHVKEGVLPRMLKSLLGARKVAKKQMASAKTPGDIAMYNAKQMAMKLGANSVYGFTGAGVGSLPCFAVSRSVTAYGRCYIEMTKSFVEQLPMLSDPNLYPLPEDTPSKITHSLNGIPRDGPLPWLDTSFESDQVKYCQEYIDMIEDYLDTSEDKHVEYKTPYKCIYGDTDSVMIYMRYLSREHIDESIRIGKLIAHLCNSLLYPKPVEMEWEKNYCPYLLLMKKKYIGLLWMDIKVRNTESGEVYDKAIPLYIEAKGVMSVRRDNAPIEANLVKLVQKILMGLTSNEKVVQANLETVPPPWKPEEKPKPLSIKQPMAPDVKLAATVIQERLMSMACGEVELKEYTITKALTRREEDYVNLQPHVKVNQDIRKRNPGTEYPLGARIPYIIANTGGRTCTLRAQDPHWMAENRISPDIIYYRDRLKKPLLQIMAPVLFQEKFKVADKKSDDMKAFLSMNNGDEGRQHCDDENYHITDVYMEDEDDEEDAEIFDLLHKENYPNRSDHGGDSSDKSKVITLADFMEFNRKHNLSSDSIIKKTQDILFSSTEKKRKFKSDVVSRAKFDLDRKRRGEGNTKGSVLDVVVVGDKQKRLFQDESDELDAFRSYRDYREVVNTLECLNKKEQTYKVLPREMKSSIKSVDDNFMRGTEIFKDIADPREGCARLIQYDWGSRLERYNKRKAYSNIDPIAYEESRKKYLSEDHEVMRIGSLEGNGGYKRSRDIYEDLPDEVKVSDINIKKKRLASHVTVQV